MEPLISFILRMMNMRDPYAIAHSEKVTRLSLDIAQKINLPPVRTATLEQAARIHNIGNLAISDAILHKPGRLTEAEFAAVQQHTILGARMIEPLELDNIIHLTILHHHENFDGSGYPHQLKGAEIPIEARIIRIADTYTALTDTRTYHPAFSHEDALEIMQESKGCFDPELLEAFLTAEM